MMMVMSSFFYRFIRYWLPPIAWMVFIFYLSSRHRVVITGTFTFDFFIFKSLHMIEYAALYFLLFRAFYSLSNKQFSLKTKLVIPIFLTIVYAASDEIHQTFTPSREGTLRDVLIDTGGILLMYWYIKNNIPLLKKFL